MPETIADTPQMTNALNDGTEAAKKKDAASTDKLYDDIVSVWQSGNPNRDQSADMAVLNEEFHNAGLLPGVDIVSVDESGSLQLRDQGTGEVQTIDQAGFREVALTAGTTTFNDGTTLGATIDPTSGSIMEITTPAGVVAGGPGVDFDIAANGDITANNTNDGTRTVYSTDGSWRVYGDASNPAQLSSINRVVRNNSGYDDDPDFVTQTVTISPGSGTATLQYGDSTIEGVNAVQNPDGSITFEPADDKSPVQSYRVTADGIVTYTDDRGLQHTERTDGSQMYLENGFLQSSKDGVVSGIDYEGVAGIEPQPDGSFVVRYDNGSTKSYNNDGSVLTSGPVDPNNPGSTVVPTNVEYPNGSGRQFNYDPASGQLTSVDDLDADGNVLKSRPVNQGGDSATVDANGTYHADPVDEAPSTWPTDGSFSYFPDTAAIESDGRERTANDTNKTVVENNGVTTTTMTAPDGTQTIVRDKGNGDAEQFYKAADGTWTRSDHGTDAPAETITDMQVDEEGLITYTDSVGRQVLARPDGSEVHATASEDGTRTTAIEYDKDMQETGRLVSTQSANTGMTEILEVRGDEAKVTLYPTADASEGTMVEAIDVTYDATTGDFAYTLPDGSIRMEVMADETRIAGVPGEDGSIEQVTFAEWRDGEISSRSYEYGENGELLSAAGTGSAANENWERQPDGTFKREDGFVGVISVGADGTFHNAFRDEEGQVKVEEQRADGAYRTRDSVPVEVELASGRKVMMEEDGSYYGEITQDSYYSAMAWDVWAQMQAPRNADGTPKAVDDMTEEERSSFDAIQNGELTPEQITAWEEFSNKGYRDNSPLYEHFANNADLVYPDDVMTFQRPSQTGPVALQGENEPAPDEVAWETRDASDAAEETATATEGDGTSNPDDPYADHGGTAEDGEGSEAA